MTGTDFATCTCPSCNWQGTDDKPRVCEVCGADEPDKETSGVCLECGKNTWWLPKCPVCRSGCDWDYADRPAKLRRGELIP